MLLVFKLIATLLLKSQCCGHSGHSQGEDGWHISFFVSHPPTQTLPGQTWPLTFKNNTATVFLSRVQYIAMYVCCTHMVYGCACLSVHLESQREILSSFMVLSFTVFRQNLSLNWTSSILVRLPGQWATRIHLSLSLQCCVAGMLSHAQIFYMGLGIWTQVVMSQSNSPCSYPLSL